MPRLTPDLRPALHPAYVRPLLGLLARQGMNPEPLLRAACIQATAQSMGDTLLSASQVEALLQMVLAQVDATRLAADYAALMPVLGHGPLALAAASSATLGAAMCCIARYLPHRAPLLEVCVQRQPEGILIELQTPLAAPPAQRFVLQAALVMLQRLLQGLSTADLGATEVQWRTQSSAATSRLLVQWRWPQTLVDAPCLSADPSTLALALAACESARQRDSGGTGNPEPQAIATMLRTWLQGIDGDWPDAAMAAARLGGSVRSLHRQLAAAGLSWRGLLDAARAERARHWLTTTAWPVAEIAHRLGYADASNFSRCMRRWWGCTAEAVRIQDLG